MLHLLVFLLSLYQLNTVTFSESVDTSNPPVNPLTSDDFESDLLPEFPLDIADYPADKRDTDENEIDFDEPMSAVSIDYTNNAIILQFKKQHENQHPTDMNKNLMRFGRASNKNPMRFGKRQIESMPEQMALDTFRPGTRFERSNGVEGIRDSRGDNFMRFGRSVDGSSKNLMRFGRSPSDFMRFGRSPSDFMRFGRSPSSFMRFGRSPSDFMRFGRSPSDFMRFGRSPSDFMRFGRSPSDFMRFGRSPSDFMRFGRSPSDFMRFGRSPGFMRFGRSNKNLMRFGRSSGMTRLGRGDKNFMRFGKSDTQSDIDRNFMRFGRPDSFMRFGRAPSNDPNTNFMRFGKRQKDDIHTSSRSTTEQNHTAKNPKNPSPAETSTVSPYQELDNDLDTLDMMFLNDLNDPTGADDN